MKIFEKECFLYKRVFRVSEYQQVIALLRDTVVFLTLLTFTVYLERVVCVFLCLCVCVSVCLCV